MDARRLFQLGTTDLGSGAAQTEGFFTPTSAARPELAVVSNALGHSDADAPADEPKDHFITKNGKTYAGTHLIIEVMEAEGLDCQHRIETALRDCVDACGATLLHMHLHRFTPQGVSGVAVLAESHISVHTWPEKGYGAFDVFMCGDAQPQLAVDVLRRAFKAGDVHVTEHLRGVGVV